MNTLLIIFLVFLNVLLIVDPILYWIVVAKHGPQNNYWPLSGFYVWWKYRKEAA